MSHVRTARPGAVPCILPGCVGGRSLCSWSCNMHSISTSASQAGQPMRRQQQRNSAAAQRIGPPVGVG